MKKWDHLKRIESEGLIAVIRAQTAHQAVELADALQSGGIGLLEITFTVPGALEAIRALKSSSRFNHLLIGAGTVLDGETARLAILEGADFIVAPNLNLDTMKLCHRYQTVVMPGVMTVTEALTALEGGADIVKLFPGDVLGPQAVKALRGPLPQLPVIPTGGVRLDNVEDWFQAGVMGIGVGGELTRKALENSQWSLAEEAAREFVAKVQEARKRYSNG